MPNKEKLELAEEDSELAEKERPAKFGTPDYSEEEKTYISNLQERLTFARDKRDDTHEEFDGLTYLQYWRENRRGANTFVKAKKNRADSNFQSGTLRTKMMAVLSSQQGLNLQPEVSAFDKNDFPIAYLGDGMESIIHKTREMELDSEKKLLRQYTMLEQGDVFVEEMWDEKWSVEKNIKQAFNGDIDKADFTKKPVKEKGRPVTKILQGPSVYLGDITSYDFEDQPYAYTCEVISYEEAERRYGDWERFDYVSRDKSSFSGDLASGDWLLNGKEVSKEQVEVIKYQDKPNNEFQIILNGVLMLPIGYPLTALRSDGEYTITQQHLTPIDHYFAYGKSYIFDNKNIVAVLDEMMRLAILKTQKSFMPPYINTTNRVLSKDVLMPGKISHGLRPGALQAVSEHEVKGVTSSEFNVMQEIKRFINENTVSPTFSGVKEQGERVTATQIMQVQRQARLMLATINLACSLLERKLATKRLCTLLEHWFEPYDKEVDAARNVLKAKYRSVSLKKMIEGEGKGMERIELTENVPKTPEQVKRIEDDYSRVLGMPVRLLFLNPKQVKKAKAEWVIHVNPKPKKSSEVNKMLFDEMIQRARILGLPLNPDYVARRFAEVWDEDPDKMYQRRQRGALQAPQRSPEGVEGARQGQTPNREGSPRIRPSVSLQAERGGESKQVGAGRV